MKILLQRVGWGLLLVIFLFPVYIGLNYLDQKYKWHDSPATRTIYALQPVQIELITEDGVTTYSFNVPSHDSEGLKTIVKRWHEKYGLKTDRITISDEGFTATIDRRPRGKIPNAD